MWQWLRAILQTKAEFNNHIFLEQTLAATLTDDAKLNTIKEKYFNRDASLENAVMALGVK